MSAAATDTTGQFRRNTIGIGEERMRWQGLSSWFFLCSATLPCVAGCTEQKNPTGKSILARHTLTWHTTPHHRAPTATRGASTATNEDAHNATARLSVRLSVHPLPTQRCPVIPIHAPHLWDTHWRAYGLMRGCIGRLRAKLPKNERFSSTRICNKPLPDKKSTSAMRQCRWKHMHATQHSLQPTITHDA